jgi:hypothetical protein
MEANDVAPVGVIAIVFIVADRVSGFMGRNLFNEVSNTQSD